MNVSKLEHVVIVLISIVGFFGSLYLEWTRQADPLFMFPVQILFILMFVHHGFQITKHDQ